MREASLLSPRSAFHVARRRRATWRTSVDPGRIQLRCASPVSWAHRVLGGRTRVTTMTYAGFGVTRVATLALLIFTTLSASTPSGVVTAKSPGQAITLRSSPTVVAD